MLGNRAAGQSVETAPDTLQLAGGRQARKHHPWSTDSVQIAGAQQFLLLEQVKDALLMSSVLHKRSMFRLFVLYKDGKNIRNFPV